MPKGVVGNMPLLHV